MGNDNMSERETLLRAEAQAHRKKTRALLRELIAAVRQFERHIDRSLVDHRNYLELQASRDAWKKSAEQWNDEARRLRERAEEEADRHLKRWEKRWEGLDDKA